MRISHCHYDTRVAQYFLKSQDISSIHYEVTGKGVSQNVGSLTRWQCNTGFIESTAERR